MRARERSRKRVAHDQARLPAAPAGGSYDPRQASRRNKPFRLTRNQESQSPVARTPSPLAACITSSRSRNRALCPTSYQVTTLAEAPLASLPPPPLVTPSWGNGGSGGGGRGTRPSALSTVDVEYQPQVSQQLHPAMPRLCAGGDDRGGLGEAVLVECLSNPLGNLLQLRRGFSTEAVRTAGVLDVSIESLPKSVQWGGGSSFFSGERGRLWRRLTDDTTMVGCKRERVIKKQRRLSEDRSSRRTRLFRCRSRYAQTDCKNGHGAATMKGMATTTHTTNGDGNGDHEHDNNIDTASLKSTIVLVC